MNQYSPHCSHRSGSHLYIKVLRSGATGTYLDRRPYSTTHMAKSKSLTPQEIYKQKKEREERERTAYLPPGLINHGNTCFMNSVLQGVRLLCHGINFERLLIDFRFEKLIATRLLSDLVHFDPIPAEIQRTAATPIVSRRSPQLTNGHNLAGPYEHPWVNTMPIGDMFLTLVYKAWESQMMRRREILSPK